MESYFQSIPAVHTTDTLARQNFVFGTRGTDQATMFIPLHNWDTRKNAGEAVPGLIAAAFQEFAKIPEAQVILAFDMPPRSGGWALPAGCSVQVQDPSGGDFSEFAAVAQEFVAKAVEQPAIAAAAQIPCVRATAIRHPMDGETRRSIGRPHFRSL